MATPRKLETSRKRHLWRENHGNFLAAFAALIIILGIITILYQQMRFRPPAFPRRPPSNLDASPMAGDEAGPSSTEPLGDDGSGADASSESEAEMVEEQPAVEATAAERSEPPDSE